MIIAKHAKILVRQRSIFVSDASEHLEAKHLQQKIELVIAQLPSQCKKAFILSRFEDLSYSSIADRMNISVNTVEKHIGKALNALRKVIIEEVK